MVTPLLLLYVYAILWTELNDANDFSLTHKQTHIETHKYMCSHLLPLTSPVMLFLNFLHHSLLIFSFVHVLYHIMFT